MQGIAPDEVVSDYRRRYEGIRVKHSVKYNSVKMYNKRGSLLRIETKINNTRDFKDFRSPNDDEGKKTRRKNKKLMDCSTERLGQKNWTTQKNWL